MTKLREQNVDIHEIYTLCFNKAISLMNGIITDEENHIIQPCIDTLQESVKRVEHGEIERLTFNSKFVHYHIPMLIAERVGFMWSLLKSINHLPDLNQLIHFQARNKWDQEKIQLVSMETPDGWYYDLWYPGYIWSDTSTLWLAPGLEWIRGTGHRFDYPQLSYVVNYLNEIEEAPGKWVVTTEISLQHTIVGRHFPIVLSFMNNNKPSSSKIIPSEVTKCLAKVFEIK